MLSTVFAPGAKMPIDDEAGFRKMVTGLLRTISSEAEQREYQRNVPGVDVGTELVCQWFDDLYHPDDATFRSLFSDDQLRAMAVFNAVFSERHPQLPSSRIVMWYGHPVWQEIERAAALALQCLEAKNTR
jgi:hypothetical protein